VIATARRPACDRELPARIAVRPTDLGHTSLPLPRDECLERRIRACDIGGRARVQRVGPSAARPSMDVALCTKVPVVLRTSSRVKPRDWSCSRSGGDPALTPAHGRPSQSRHALALDGRTAHRMALSETTAQGDSAKHALTGHLGQNARRPALIRGRPRRDEPNVGRLRARPPMRTGVPARECSVRDIRLEAEAGRVPEVRTAPFASSLRARRCGRHR
jgi:hypothetical protein